MSKSSQGCVLRFFHALPSTQSFDIYCDDKLINKDLLYEDFTVYHKVEAGEHEILLTPHKETTPLIKRSIWCGPARIYTLLITSMLRLDTLTFYFINDPIRPIPENQALLRIGPYSQVPELMSLYAGDEENCLFKKIVPHQVSHYQVFSPDCYHFFLKYKLEPALVSQLANCQLKASRLYTLYIIGNGSKAYPNKLLLSIDGNSYLRP